MLLQPSAECCGEEVWRGEEGTAVLFCKDRYHLQLSGNSAQGHCRSEKEGCDEGSVNFLSVPKSKLETVDALYLEDLQPHPAKTSSDPGKKLKNCCREAFQCEDS